MDMDGPALAPPEGVTPDLDNPANENGLAMFVLIFCSVISTICVLLRGYGKVYLLKRFQLEEGLVLCAFGCFWGCVWSMFGVLKTPGYFVHQYEVRLGDLIPMTYYIFVMGNIYVVVLALLKVAMLSEWSRILVPRNNRTSSVFWWGCMIMIAIQVLACVGNVIALNVQCIPHQASWDFTILDAKCFPLYTLQLSSGIIYLTTDIIMFFMPQHLIWTLQMSWKKRLGVSVVFGLGLLACVAAAFRLQVTVVYGHATDATYNLGSMIFWVMAEMTCAFFVVCVPTIPKILQDTGIIRSIKRRFGLTKTGPTGGSGYGTKGGLPTNRSIPTSTSKAYYMLDESGVEMGDVKSGSTSSTEHLRQEDKDNSTVATPARGQIVRTTRITVNESAEAGYGRKEGYPARSWD